MSDQERKATLVRHHGYPGHFIAADWCRFRLHTTLGRYRVSTVGDYRPPSERVGETVGPMREIGFRRFFETMVFELGADGEPSTWREIDAAAYETAEEAELGHEQLVQRFLARGEEGP